MNKAIANIIKGMGNINLVPDIPDSIPETNLYTAWEDVGKAFQATNNNIWQAFNEAKQTIHPAER